MSETDIRIDKVLNSTFLTRKDITFLFSLFDLSANAAARVYRGMKETYAKRSKEKDMVVISCRVPKQIGWDYLEQYGITAETTRSKKEHDESYIS